MRVVEAVSQAILSGLKLTVWSFRFMAEIVQKPLAERLLSFLLPLEQGLLPPAMVNVWSRHIVDSLILAAMILGLSEFCHRCPQYFGPIDIHSHIRALRDQQTSPSSYSISPVNLRGRANHLATKAEGL